MSYDKMRVLLMPMWIAASRYWENIHATLYQDGHGNGIHFHDIRSSSRRLSESTRYCQSGMRRLPRIRWKQSASFKSKYCRSACRLSAEAVKRVQVGSAQ